MPTQIIGMFIDASVEIRRLRGLVAYQRYAENRGALGLALGWFVGPIKHKRLDFGVCLSLSDIGMHAESIIIPDIAEPRVGSREVSPDEFHNAGFLFVRYRFRL